MHRIYVVLEDETGGNAIYEQMDGAEIGGAVYFALVKVDLRGKRVGEAPIVLRQRIENGVETLDEIERSDETAEVFEHFADLVA